MKEYDKGKDEMRLKKLLVSTACVVLGVGMFAGCAKEEDTVIEVSMETTSSETVEMSKEVSVEVSEEVSTEAETEAEMQAEAKTPETTEAINPDDIKLRNPFIESFADSVVLPAEPDMTFDADVKMDLNQLTLVGMGTVSKNLGELTTEDMLSVGYVDAFGDKATKDEDLEMIGACAKGYTFDAYYDEAVIDRILVMEYNAEKDLDKNLPEVSMKFTEFGIQVGEDAETLKQLGVPALIAKIDEDMTYYWQVETEGDGCCLCVKATEHIITSIEIMIYQN